MGAAADLCDVRQSVVVVVVVVGTGQRREFAWLLVSLVRIELVLTTDSYICR